jgi:tetratricopeptide (TPR) repeat protein
MANTSDTERREKRRKLSGILTLIFAALFAVLSHVDSFFFWVFLGATFYCGFLYFYFRPLVEDPYVSFDPTGNFRPPAFSFANSPGVLRKMIFVFGGLAFLVIALVASGLFSSKNTDPADTSAAETPVDNTVNPDAILNKGIASYNKQDYDSAMIYYEQVLTIDPSNDPAIYNKALVYYSQEKYQRSLKTLQTDMPYVLEDGNAALLLGDSYLGVQKTDSALIYFNIAYDHNIKDPKFLQSLAEMSEKDNAPRALQIYKEILEQDKSRDDIAKKIASLESK